MAQYTVTVHDLMKNGFDFGLNDYPIFNEEYRAVLNNAILKYYEFREIGFPNPWLWRDRLRNRMEIIMRNKYNDLYKAKEIDFNPLYNIELHETYERKLTSDTSSSATLTDVGSMTENGNNLALSSRFPSEEMTEDNLSSNLFVDTANKNKGTTNTQSNNTQSTRGTDTGNSIETFEHTTKGSSAGLPFSKAMLQLKSYYDQYRLDEQVIAELSDLFMNLW